jgi:hypothetical protein
MAAVIVLILRVVESCASAEISSDGLTGQRQADAVLAAATPPRNNQPFAGSGQPANGVSSPFHPFK